MDIGVAVKKYREAKGLTLRDLERASGVSNAYISQIETGKIKNVGLDHLFKLSNVLGRNFILEVLGLDLPVENHGLIDDVQRNRIPHACPVCKGSQWVLSTLYTLGTAVAGVDNVPCRSCEGTGIVWGGGE